MTRLYVACPKNEVRCGKKCILKGVCGGYLLGQMDYLSTVSQVRVSHTEIANDPSYKLLKNIKNGLSCVGGTGSYTKTSYQFWIENDLIVNSYSHH